MTPLCAIAVPARPARPARPAPGARRLAAVLLAGLAGLTGPIAAVGAAVPAGAQPVGERAGDAVVVSGAEPGRRLTEGDSETSFSLELPTGAACPGDSANDGYRVQTFVVPADDDPGELVYESTKPAGDGRWALYDVNTRPYVQVLTAMNDGPGEPGPIDALSQLSFAVFPPGELAEGRHHIGVACTLYNETTRYWDVDLDLARDAGAGPAEVRWTVVGAVAPSGGSSPAVAVVAVAVAVAAVALGAGGLLVARRRSPSPQTPSEPAP